MNELPGEGPRAPEPGIRERESEILQRVRSGEPEAFEYFVRTYQRRVFRLIYTPVRNAGAADAEIRKKSWAGLAEELGRCEALGVPQLIFHPGSHPDEAEGLREADSKSRLQELVQARFGEGPVYRIAAVTGPPHQRHFVAQVLAGGSVAGEGSGRSKKEAEQAAARAALASDLLAEVRQCLLLHRLRGVTAMSARAALRLAIRGGADVLGREDLGRLTPGRAADLALFDVDDLAYAGGLPAPSAALAFCVGRRRAHTVMVNGEIVVSEGRLVRVEEARLVRQQNELAAVLAGGG